jgi:hypothetical protein
VKLIPVTQYLCMSMKLDSVKRSQLWAGVGTPLLRSSINTNLLLSSTRSSTNSLCIVINRG